MRDTKDMTMVSILQMAQPIYTAQTILRSTSCFAIYHLANAAIVQSLVAVRYKRLVHVCLAISLMTNQ